MIERLGGAIYLICCGVSGLVVIRLVVLVQQGYADAHSDSVNLACGGVFAVLVFVVGRVVRYVLVGE